MDSMYNLSDVTFTIPIRIDSKDRLRNLQIVIYDYLLKHFNTNILICEDSPEPTLMHDFPHCSYMHFKGNPEHTHRTKTLNDMARVTTTPIIVNMDADILIKPESVIHAIESIRENVYDVVIPYDGMCLNVPTKSFKQIVLGISQRRINAPGLEITNKNAVGGMVAWKRETFMKSGMENEHFISWGYEDNERINRVKTLGIRANRLSGPIYHLDHWRGVNSKGDHPHVKANIEEYNKITKMKRPELVNYIKTWEWAYKQKS